MVYRCSQRCRCVGVADRLSTQAGVPVVEAVGSFSHLFFVVVGRSMACRRLVCVVEELWLDVVWLLVSAVAVG